MKTASATTAPTLALTGSGARHGACPLSLPHPIRVRLFWSDGRSLIQSCG